MKAPPAETVIDGVVAPLLHNKLPLKLEAVKTELVQLSVTVTVGAGGIGFGAAMPLASGLVHPFTVCVTVYVPAAVTVIDGVVAPVLHNKLPVKPDAVNIELLQLLVTVTTGTDTTELLGAATPIPVPLVHPFTVWVTV